MLSHSPALMQPSHSGLLRIRERLVLGLGAALWPCSGGKTGPCLAGLSGETKGSVSSDSTSLVCGLGCHRMW